VRVRNSARAIVEIMSTCVTSPTDVYLALFPIVEAHYELILFEVALARAETAQASSPHAF
jgi:hypothetical protein